ncbi:MAG: hypothetical protein PHG67_04095 [Bacteroidales bacterium]|jgi:hypothetical protein|nr:hypothetical protein [Bacteroidales bacterium]HOI32500.1 hypothetical protein [Bacteroidales bacterium]
MDEKLLNSLTNFLNFGMIKPDKIQVNFYKMLIGVLTFFTHTLLRALHQNL